MVAPPRAERIACARRNAAEEAHRGAKNLPLPEGEGRGEGDRGRVCDWRSKPDLRPVTARTLRCFCWIILSLVLASTSARADKVDQYVEAILKKFNVPGLSLAVVKDGKVIKSKGYGLCKFVGEVVWKGNSDLERLAVRHRLTRLSSQRVAQSNSSSRTALHFPPDLLCALSKLLTPSDVVEGILGQL